MPHIFMKTDYRGAKSSEVPFAHDVLSNVWAFAHIEQEVINAENEIPTYEFTAPSTKATTQAQQVPVNLGDLSHKEKVVNLIKVDPYLDERSSWSRIVWGMRNEGCSEDFARAISKKSDKYSDEGFDNVWNSNGESKVTMGTLNYYARLSDEKEYIKLHTHKDAADAAAEWTQSDLAEKFDELQGDDVIYQNEMLYVYFEGQWRTDKKGFLLKRMFSQTLSTYFGNFPNGKTFYSKTLKTLQSSKPLDGCIDLLKSILASKLQKIEFDIGEDQFYNIQFKNGVYDLKENTFRARTKFDYVTRILDWNYKPLKSIPQSVMEEVELFTKKLQPEKEQRDLMLGFQKYCIVGDVASKLAKLNIGYSAHNGKTTIIQVHFVCFPIYTAKLDNRSFCQSFEKAHKQFLTVITEPIRMVYLEEMSAKKELDAERWKDFIDGELNVEILYGTSKTATHKAKINIATNWDLKFPNCNGVQTRTIVQHFDSKFRAVEEDDFEQHIYKKDLHFIEKFKDEDYKNAYFHLLLRYPNIPIIPQHNRNLFEGLMDEYDVFSNHLADFFEITGKDHDIVSKDYLETIFSEKKIKWDEILRQIKKREKDGLKYDKARRKNGKRGVVIGLKKRADAGSGDDSDSD